MEEKLTLVTDFSKLKAGDLVVVKDCICGRSVRSMLTLQFENGFVGTCWRKLPEHICSGWTLPHVISSRTVASGRVYRVDTGMEQGEVIEKADSRPLETVR